jgi:hypothetical protein
MRQPIEQLELTSEELVPVNADTLDAVSTGDIDAIPTTERAAIGPTHLASGLSHFRRDTYRESSLHPDKLEFLDQLIDNIGATDLGDDQGEMWSQAELTSLVPGRVSFVVAAESPVPEEQNQYPAPPPGMCGNTVCEADETCTTCPIDCQLCDQPPPWEGGGSVDAGVDAGPPAPDAMIIVEQKDM